MQCYLEINTEICGTVADVERDLTAKIEAVERAAGETGVRLLWAATHPFSAWHEQQITPNPRYAKLVELLQDSARRLVTFGLHVHVGVDSGDKAVMISDRILRHLPTLLALSANSPFWNGRNTGLHSQRSKVMADLPTAGLPPLMRNWSEYVWLLRHMVSTGFIQTIREVWWDVRPHHNFGTVEVRICDMPPDLPCVLALTALTQCLVHALSLEIDRGTYQHDSHPMMVRLNKWRACRHGLSADLVDPYTMESAPARDVVRKLCSKLMPTARELNCVPYIESALALAGQPTGSEQQLTSHRECGGDLVEVTRRMAARPWR
jgi:carboxylate-amine ligase